MSISKNKVPPQPDYSYLYKGQWHPGYYRRGIDTYDVLVDGMYYGTVQVNRDDGDKELFARAKVVFSHFEYIAKERVTFKLFGRCEARMAHDNIKETKERPRRRYIKVKPRADEAVENKKEEAILAVRMFDGYVEEFPDIYAYCKHFCVKRADANKRITANHELVVNGCDRGKKYHKHNYRYIFYKSDLPLIMKLTILQQYAGNLTAEEIVNAIEEEKQNILRRKLAYDDTQERYSQMRKRKTNRSIRTSNR